MQAVEEGVKAVEAGRQARLWDLEGLGAGNSQEARGHAGVLIEEARWLLLRAVRGSARAARDLHALEAALIGRASKRDAYACEILAAMCASGLGADRNPEDAREWLVRAVELLEDHVQRPVAGDHGFMLLPTEEPECAYRPLYTAEGVLITDEIGAARTNLGEVCFDRWGRPLVDVQVCRGPTRATAKSVAARIAREATLEDFAWACRRTTRQFRLALIAARVIAHGRMGFQRCRSGVVSRLVAAA
ncbi:MAG: hypothetical protein ACXWIP_14090 [Burkholderiales bacterium]